MRRSTILFVITLLVLHARAQQVTQRAIPDDNLAYPVLITLGDGSSGSGFYIADSNAHYLVTAKHVLYKNKRPEQITPKQPDPLELISGNASLLSYSKDPADSTQNLVTLDLSVLEAAGNIKRHPTQDVVVVKIALQSVPDKLPNPLNRGHHSATGKDWDSRSSFGCC